MADSKVDNVEEYRASITSINKKGDIVNTSITSIKIRMTQSINYKNQGLLQCIIDLIKCTIRKKTKTPRTSYPQRQFRCLCFD